VEDQVPDRTAVDGADRKTLSTLELTDELGTEDSPGDVDVAVLHGEGHRLGVGEVADDDPVDLRGELAVVVRVRLQHRLLTLGVLGDVPGARSVDRRLREGDALFGRERVRVSRQVRRRSEELREVGDRTAERELDRARVDSLDALEERGGQGVGHAIRAVWAEGE